MRTTIVLADDHELVRDGLKALIDAEADLEVVGEAATAEHHFGTDPLGHAADVVAPGGVILLVGEAGVGVGTVYRHFPTKDALVRAVIEHNLWNTDPALKVYALGPMFRRERPQKGRMRQFHQIGAEALGRSDPLIDAEILLLLAASDSAQTDWRKVSRTIHRTVRIASG